MGVMGCDEKFKRMCAGPHVDLIVPGTNENLSKHQCRVWLDCMEQLGEYNGECI